MKKFNGSWGIFWLWMILFFPASLIYWLAKQEEVKKGHRYYNEN